MGILAIWYEMAFRRPMIDEKTGFLLYHQANNTKS